MRFLFRSKRLSFGLAALLILVALAVLLPSSASSIYFGEGEWVRTGYSTNTPNNCNQSAGEFCKEWELDGEPTGDLCCVSGSTCLARNLRLPPP